MAVHKAMCPFSTLVKHSLWYALGDPKCSTRVTSVVPSLQGEGLHTATPTILHTCTVLQNHTGRAPQYSMDDQFQQWDCLQISQSKAPYCNPTYQ